MSWDVNPMLTSEVCRALQHHSIGRSAEEGSGDMNAAVILIQMNASLQWTNPRSIDRSIDRPTDRPAKDDDGLNVRRITGRMALSIFQQSIVYSNIIETAFLH